VKAISEEVASMKKHSLSDCLGNVMGPQPHFQGPKAHRKPQLLFEVPVLQLLLVKKRFLHELEVYLTAAIVLVTLK